MQVCQQYYQYSEIRIAYALPKQSEGKYFQRQDIFENCIYYVFTSIANFIQVIYFYTNDFFPLFFSDIKNQFLRSLETSDSSGCSSLTSRSPTSATTSPLSSLHSGRSDIDATTSPISGYGTSLVNATQPPITTKVINTPPDLLLWNRNPSLLIHNNR